MGSFRCPEPPALGEKGTGCESPTGPLLYCRAVFHGGMFPPATGAKALGRRKTAMRLSQNTCLKSTYHFLRTFKERYAPKSRCHAAQCGAGVAGTAKALPKRWCALMRPSHPLMIGTNRTCWNLIPARPFFCERIRSRLSMGAIATLRLCGRAAIEPAPFQ